MELTVVSSFYLIHVKNLGRTYNMEEERGLFWEAPGDRLGPAKASYKEHLDSTKRKRFLKFKLPESRASSISIVFLSLDRQTKRPAHLLLIFTERILPQRGGHISEIPQSFQGWDPLMWCWQRMLRNGRTQSLFRCLYKEWGRYFHNTAYATRVSLFFSRWFHLLYHGYVWK